MLKKQSPGSTSTYHKFHLTPIKIVHVNFPNSLINYPYSDIFVKVGDQVSEGQILASMDTNETEGSIAPSIAEQSCQLSQHSKNLITYSQM